MNKITLTITTLLFSNIVAHASTSWISSEARKSVTAIQKSAQGLQQDFGGQHVVHPIVVPFLVELTASGQPF